MLSNKFKEAFRWYGIAIIASLLLALVQLWSVLFYYPNEKQDSHLGLKNNELAVTVPIVDLTIISAGSLWGIEEERFERVENEEFEDSLWSVKLEKKGWVLQRKGKTEEVWLFSGVILKENKMASVFYCDNCEEKWQLIQEGDLFFDLFVTTVDSTNVVVEDINGVEWSMGLFDVNLKEQTEKRK